MVLLLFLSPHPSYSRRMNDFSDFIENEMDNYVN